jgi:hypothetical protein
VEYGTYSAYKIMIQEETRLTNSEEFVITLKEVEVLLDAADLHEENETEYAAFNKSALLLLTGKFENFAESIAEDYIACINYLQPCCDLISDALRLQHTFKLMANFETYKQKHMHEKAVNAFTELGSLWMSNSNSVDLKIDCKFSYGKHGETELKKLFSAIGIDNVFEVISVMKEQETLLGGEDSRFRIDFKGIFNSVTGLRNNILHQNASPNLTTPMIRNYKEDFKLFAQELENYLNNDLYRISNTCVKVGESFDDAFVQ